VDLVGRLMAKCHASQATVKLNRSTCGSKWKFPLPVAVVSIYAFAWLLVVKKTTAAFDMGVHG
jgi:hypothetical protein